MKIKRIEWLKETENEKMETEQKGRLTEKIKQEVKMKTDKITCEQMKKPNALEYFKSLNPSNWEVIALIANCKYAQTPEMLEYCKSLNPDTRDVCTLIVKYKFIQTLEMIKYYKSLNPDA